MTIKKIYYSVNEAAELCCLSRSGFLSRCEKLNINTKKITDKSLVRIKTWHPKKQKPKASLQILVPDIEAVEIMKIRRFHDCTNWEAVKIYLRGKK